MYSKEELLVYRSYISTERDIPKFMYIKKNKIYKDKPKEYVLSYKKTKDTKTLYKRNKKQIVGENNEY